jgi:methionyl-tRNA formyltransferase
MASEVAGSEKHTQLFGCSAQPLDLPSKLPALCEKAVRIAYFGLPLGALLLAADGHELVSVALSPVEGVGRRRLLRTVAPTTLLSLELGEAAWLERLREVRPELVVSWFWTRKLSRAIIELAPRGALGAHPSLLPRHRGPDPYFAAIDAGDLLTGVSVHRLDVEYDTGPVLAREIMPLEGVDSAELARALDRPSLRLLRASVGALGRGELFTEQPQAASDATLAPRPSEAQRRIDFRWCTERVLRRLRALAPVPGVALEIRKLRFFATRAVRVDDVPFALDAGEAELDETRVCIRTGDAAIRIERAELESGETVDGRDLARLLAQAKRV